MFSYARTAMLVFRMASLLIGVITSPALAAAIDSPSGSWATANGNSVVAIEPCGEALCGRIVGINRAPSEPMPTDVNGRSQCGLTVITNEKPEGDGTWLGEVTDPRNGATYNAKLWLDESGDLHLRGYLGIPLLGATQTWRKFTGHLTAECGLG
jgi:uncharacterized protein (DUF2147 family)